jgi:hypothetical protein
VVKKKVGKEEYVVLSSVLSGHLLSREEVGYSNICFVRASDQFS